MCVRSAHLTNGGNDEMVSTAGLELHTHGFPSQVSGRHFSEAKVMLPL